MGVIKTGDRIRKPPGTPNTRRLYNGNFVLKDHGITKNQYEIRKENLSALGAAFLYHAWKSGVYLISVENKETGELYRYVGQSRQIGVRWSQHLGKAASLVKQQESELVSKITMEHNEEKMHLLMAMAIQFPDKYRVMVEILSLTNKLFLDSVEAGMTADYARDMNPLHYITNVRPEFGYIRWGENLTAIFGKIPQVDRIEELTFVSTVQTYMKHREYDGNLNRLLYDAIASQTLPSAIYLLVLKCTVANYIGMVTVNPTMEYAMRKIIDNIMTVVMGIYTNAVEFDPNVVSPVDGRLNRKITNYNILSQLLIEGALQRKSAELLVIRCKEIDDETLDGLKARKHNRSVNLASPRKHKGKYLGAGSDIMENLASIHSNQLDDAYIDYNQEIYDQVVAQVAKNKSDIFYFGAAKEKAGVIDPKKGHGRPPKPKRILDELNATALGKNIADDIRKYFGSKI